MKFSIEQIKDALSKKGYIFFDNNKPYKLNIIGIRNNHEIAGVFSDWIYVIYRDEQLELKIHEFPITTDPGTYWLKTPIKVEGTAILIPGQYRDSHTVELFRGEYKALRQIGDVSVWEDDHSSSNLDIEGNIKKGLFGVHIYRTDDKLRVWDSGSQVFENESDFTFLTNTCDKAAELHGNSFTYTLLEEGDVH